MLFFGGCGIYQSYRRMLPALDSRLPCIGRPLFTSYKHIHKTASSCLLLGRRRNVSTWIHSSQHHRKSFTRSSTLSFAATRGLRQGNTTSESGIGANRLQQTLRDGLSPAFGAWQMLPGSFVSRLLASGGYSWILVDCEHGDIDDASMREVVRVVADVGVSPVVRIPGLESWMVKRALDSGAHGILVPLVRTVEECKNLVRWAKFPPKGVRGFGAPIVHESLNMESGREYLERANDNILVFVQIETKEALDNVSETGYADDRSL